MRVLMAFVALSMLAGCGSDVTWILLELQSTHEVTAEVDNIQSWVQHPDTREQLTTFGVVLTDEDDFPMTVLLEPETSNPRTLLIRIEARKVDTVVASVTFTVDWIAGADNFPEPITLD